jgi:hypothetical protein
LDGTAAFVHTPPGLEPAFTQRLLDRQPEIDEALRRMVSGMETRERDPQSTRRGP